MKKLIVVFLCLFFYQHFICAQKFRPELSVAFIPDSMINNASAVVRLDQIEFNCLPNKQAKLKRYYAITILNKNGDNFNSVDLRYNKLITINKLKGSIYDKDGKLISHLGKNDITDYRYINNGSFYQDSRAKFAKLTHNVYPYTIIYEYAYLLKDYLDIPNWYPIRRYNTSVISSEYTLTVPTNDSVKYKIINAKYEPIIHRKESETIYAWRAQDLEAIDNEPFAPDFKQICPQLMISSYNIQYGDYKGRNDSWKEFGEFFYTMNCDTNILPETAIERIDQLTKDLNTNDEKIKILYKELQNTTRYVNITFGHGGLKTYNADYVYKNKYGDCKALSNYMHTMLNYIGIESFWALVNAGKRKADVDPEFSSSQFNHVILAVPNSNDTIWLECTSQDLPFNYLGSFSGNRHALLLTPEGGKLVKTPDYWASDNLLKIVAFVDIKSEGYAYSTTEFLSTGTQSREYEKVFKSFSDDEKKEWLYTHFDLPSFKILSFNFSKPYCDSAAISLKFETELSHYISKSGKRWFFNPNMYSNYIMVPKKIKNRHLPIIRNSSYLDFDTIVYKIPDDLTIESLPDSNLCILTDFGQYIARIYHNSDDNTITYTRRLKMNRFYNPASQYENLRDFYKQLSKADNRKIVLVRP